MADDTEMTTVVLGVDDGPHCQAAFRRALKVFSKDTTLYHLVTVRPQETEYQLDELYGVTFRDYWQEVEEQRQKKCQAILDKFRAVAQDKGIQFRVVELQGDAREELCRYCARVNADVLVLGSRGTGLLTGLILGSVSNYCTHHAPCAVLVDRIEDGEVSVDAASAPSAGS